MFTPGAAATGFDMELYRAIEWREWHSVVVEWAVVISICRDLGCNVGIAKEV